MSNNTSGSFYIHGSSPGEQARLTSLNAFLNERCLPEIRMRGGERVLDVGSGLGQFSRALARAVGPSGCVIGVERDAEQLREAMRQANSDGERDLVDFRIGDAYDPPLSVDEWGTFDVAHTRFLLEHVPDPLRVVRTMVRAVRPGGRIILADDDHDVLRMHPEPAGVRALWKAYMRTYDRAGNDPYIGRRLVSLLHQAGAEPRRNNWVFFGGCAGDPVFPLLVKNLYEVLRLAKEPILRWNLHDPADFDVALNQLERWGLRPDAALWFAVCFAEAVKPQSA